MQSRVANAGRLIRGLCDQLERERSLDHAVIWDPARSKLSPGERILALLVCLFMRLRPLYRVHEGLFDGKTAGASVRLGPLATGQEEAA